LTTALIAAGGITAVAMFFSLVEWDSLTEGHARPATQILNAARWALVIALAWVLIPLTMSAVPTERIVTLVGIAGLIGALMLIPVRWFVRIGGRDPAWELRRIRIEVTQLTNRVRRDPDAIRPDRLRDLIDRIQRACSSETTELCDLLAAEVEDVLARRESWNEAGRRTIRIYELCRRLWPGAMPPPDFEPEEATFRWKMYRTFGQLMDAGESGPDADRRNEFGRLLDSLEAFRRPDTEGLIRDIRLSAEDWLARHSSDRTWIEAFDFSILGPNGLEEVKQIWGRDAALWGAELNEDDCRLLAEDLARRTKVG
jgi:hypothetical protein